MSDPEIAAFLRDRCRRRLSWPELALCEEIANGHEFDPASEDGHTFRRLQTEFSREIGNALAGKEGL